MKKKLFVFVVFISSVLLAQEKFSKEISFVTDNDLYVSVEKDRYYTSGVFFTYRYLSNKKREHLEKYILEWQIGQEMYTPYKAVVNTMQEHDRPFAGYLYGGFGINKVYKKSQILKTSIQIGFIGKNSYARELQGFIHRMYDFDEAKGWKYQIKDALGVNVDATYIKSLKKINNKSIDASWVSSGKIGTVYTSIASGFYTRIGFKPLQQLANTVAFNTGLNNKETNFFREIESFIYIKPMLYYNVYDATLQGSFLNKGSLVTKEIIPFVFTLNLGLRFTSNRFNLGYDFVYTTSTSKGLRHTYGQKYGRITLSYLLR